MTRAGPRKAALGLFAPVQTDEKQLANLQGSGAGAGGLISMQFQKLRRRNNKFQKVNK
jgi:hypothetical protein